MSGADNEVSSSSPCECEDCSHRIHILAPDEYRSFLDFHIAQYTQEKPEVSISLEFVTTRDWQVLQSRLTSTDTNKYWDWNGAIFPATLTGRLLQDDLLWDFSKQAHRLTEWSKILPVFQRQSKYSTQVVYEEEYDGDPVIAMPLDGNTVNMYYRRDLFRQYNVSVPRTWDEYNKAAEFFDSVTIDGKSIAGSCVSRQFKCHNAYWTSLLLSSMTQSEGTSSGFFFDPMTGEPNFGDALKETLRLMAEQLKYGSDNELDAGCQNLDFAAGKCALTYTWENQVLRERKTKNLDIGVAPTPGSPRVLDRATGKLEDCTTIICPFATYYPDIGLVNRAPYAAFGGWTAGVNNSTSTGQKHATVDFFSFVQSHSMDDILPNPRSNTTHPYQYSHTKAYPWINYAGVEEQAAFEYADSVQAINSENAVLDLRIPQANNFLEVMDEEIYYYLQKVRERPDMEEDQAEGLRGRVSSQIERRIREMIPDQISFLESYQNSVGFSTAPIESFNYINDHFRSAAYGLSGVICIGSFSLICWTLLFRNNRVMKAFQPFLLIQCAVGCLLMGASIIPLGFDDATFDVDTLNVTCMIAPWGYVIGFTVFFSSVYCKVHECMKIYRDPNKYKILLVSKGFAFRFTCRLLTLNGCILAAWTVTDPLRWERNEIEGAEVYPDGTVETYGLCRGGITSFVFAVVLFLMNIIFLLIGIFRALKCRFLVLEFSELHWLTLSFFPFLECWLIGGPIVALTLTRPNVVFTTVSMIMAFSSMAGGLSIFAPKDWFVRKYRDLEMRSRKNMNQTTSAGIMVVSHPTFESRKQVDILQQQVEKAHAINTELEIEIRGMKDRFKEMSTGDKFGPRGNFPSFAVDSPESKGKKVVSYSQKDMSKAVDGGDLAALDQFEKVWQMTDEDEETGMVGASAPMSGILESFSPLKKESDDDPVPIPTSVSVNRSPSPTNETQEAYSLDVENKMSMVEEESDTSEAQKSDVDDPADALIKGRDFSDLNNMIDLDDLSGLGAKAELLAQSLKEKIVGSELFGEAKPPVPEVSTNAAPSTTSRYAESAPPVGASLFSSLVQSSGQSSGEPSKTDIQKEDDNADTSEANFVDMKYSDSNLASSSNGILSPEGSNKKAGVSFTGDTQFHTGSYNLGQWAAVGGLSSILADFSDTSSFSSRTSSAFSVSSMEATTRASSLDTNFATELDTLVARKDWDGVQLAAKNFEASKEDDEKNSHRSSIEEKKRKKRELEAWRESVTSGISGPKQLN